jgi:hypothetical protein
MKITPKSKKKPNLARQKMLQDYFTNAILIAAMAQAVKQKPEVTL